MGTTTPRSNLPYPFETDTFDVATDMEALATAVDAGTTVLLYENTFALAPPSGNFTIPAIPQTCRDLRLHISLKDTQSVTNTQVPWCFQFNGDSGSNYYYSKQIVGNFPGSGNPSMMGGGPFTNTAAGLYASTSAVGLGVAGTSYMSNVVDIIDYRNNSNFKTGLFTNGGVSSTTTAVFQSGQFAYVGAGAISSITLIPNGGVGIAAGSIIRVYGIG